jgi:hypothetical protein
LNPFELRASDDLASEFRFDFGYLENHAKLRQALNGSPVLYPFCICSASVLYLLHLQR